MIPIRRRSRREEHPVGMSTTGVAATSARRSTPPPGLDLVLP
jgi:hypothetical protein